jgi:hypothetical protein
VEDTCHEILTFQGFRHQRGERRSLSASRLVKSRNDQDHPFWSIGGRDQDYLVNSGIMSWEAEAFALQNFKSRDSDVI